MMIRVLLASFLSLSLALDGQPGSAHIPCTPPESGEAPQLSRDFIGPFPTSVSLDSLQQLCPEAVATVEFGFETVWAALDLSFGPLTILAGQSWRNNHMFAEPNKAAPVVEWSAKPSHWSVRGCGALLPGRVRSCATWSELVAAYGSLGEANAEFGPVRVRLSTLPGFIFRLDVTNVVVGSIEVHQDLSRIPGTARIVEIYIVPNGTAAGLPENGPGERISDGWR